MQTNFYRWDSRGVYGGSFTQEDTDAVPANSTTTAPPEIPPGRVALWVGGWVIGDEPAAPTLIDLVPFSVSARQCRLELRAAGILELVPQIIAAIPDDGERQDAEIDWEFASMVERTNPLVEVIRVATNRTAAEIDDMFRRAIKR